MSSARLSSAVLVSALMRLAEQQGGFPVVVQKGDENAGTILVILTERGGKAVLLERLLQVDGSYNWQFSTNQVVENTRDLSESIARRRKFDPDLWLLELDIPSLERFAAEMNAFN